ncbi:hypothetical protein VNI00_019400, partial [Paramarasmius palmivorus]
FLADSRSDEEEDVQPESIKLWLPSDVPEEKHKTVLSDGLDQTEAKLQEARCYDALNALRHTLRIKARMMQFKNTNVRGQRESGRSRAVINRMYKKARCFASRYRTACKAYKQLVGSDAWEKSLQVLEDSDIRSYRDPALVKKGHGRQGTRETEEEEEEDHLSQDSGLQLIVPDRTEWAHRRVHGTGETRKEQSWIWTTGGRINIHDGGEEGDNKLLRSEWCRSWTRVKRAEEEVVLIREEMRRMLVFLGYRGNEWRSWKMRWEAVEKELPKGLVVEVMEAYAAMREVLQLRLSDSFEREWKKPLDAEAKGKEDEFEDEETEGEGLEGEADKSRGILAEEEGRDGEQEQE